MDKYVINKNVPNAGAVVAYVHKGKATTVSLTGDDIIKKVSDNGIEQNIKIPAASQSDLEALYNIGHYMVEMVPDKAGSK